MSARAEDPSVTFIHPASPSGETRKTAEVEMFSDQPSVLGWRILAVPGSRITLRGKVFQAASSLAVPLKDLGFEEKTTIAEGSVQAEARHSLVLPETGKPAVYLVQWQALNGETPHAAGTVRLRLSPRGLLTPLQSVSVMAEDDLKPWIPVFERDQVKVVTLAHAERLPAWQGLLFVKASPAMLEKIKSQPLEPGQCLVVIGDLPGMRETMLMKPAGRGRLMVVPASRCKDFPSDPALQRLIVEFCQSAS
ncbi:hypothetical protein [Prosthecobacter sp.]|uniref:hypothetical protein n=1 Tax=Prosthecobacter sp. TaxID=1965333 RepID=UPI003784876D